MQWCVSVTQHLEGRGRRMRKFKAILRSTARETEGLGYTKFILISKPP